MLPNRGDEDRQLGPLVSKNSGQSACRACGSMFEQTEERHVIPLPPFDARRARGRRGQ